LSQEKSQKKKKKKSEKHEKNLALGLVLGYSFPVMNDMLFPADPAEYEEYCAVMGAMADEADLLPDPEPEDLDCEEESEESEDWDGFNSDGEADADALASAGWGTDEDYGCYGDGDW
jgi:hypothetical protein